MSDRKAILALFIEKLLKSKDFSVKGIESAFAAFEKGLSEKKIKPPPPNRGGPEYIPTTLQDAIAASKVPIKVVYFVNKYGNKESEIITNMIFEEDAVGAIAVGLQDGAHIAPLTIREVTACKSNGYRYKGSNTVGSAEHTSDSNRV